MDYGIEMLAKAEHEWNSRSLAPIRDDDAQMKDGQPGLLSRQAGHILQALGDKLISLGKQLEDR